MPKPPPHAAPLPASRPEFAAAKCAHCPLLALPYPCRGRQYCELTDPANPRYDARFAAILLHHANGTPLPVPLPVPRPTAESRAVVRPPSLARKAATFARALVGYVASGMVNVSAEEKAARLAICEKCDQFAEGRCKKCGCTMRLKAAWEQMKCPLDKWPKP